MLAIFEEEIARRIGEVRTHASSLVKGMAKMHPDPNLQARRLPITAGVGSERLGVCDRAGARPIGDPPNRAFAAVKRINARDAPSFRRAWLFHPAWLR